MKPEIKKENVRTLFESRFIRVFDLQYEEGKHYFDATRRSADNLMAIKSEEEFRSALPEIWPNKPENLLSQPTHPDNCQATALPQVKAPSFLHIEKFHAGYTAEHHIFYALP